MADRVIRLEKIGVATSVGASLCIMSKFKHSINYIGNQNTTRKIIIK